MSHGGGVVRIVADATTNRMSPFYLVQGPHNSAVILSFGTKESILNTKFKSILLPFETA